MTIQMRCLSIVLTVLAGFYPATAQPVTPRVAASSNHTLLLKRDGTVWAWGNNTYGQLGDGTTASSGLPVQVAGLSGVISVSASAGGHYSVAVKGDGTVWAWGENTHGQLGDGTRTSSGVPVQVAGLGSVLSAAAGFDHTTASKADGSVWTWGKWLGPPDRHGHETDALAPLQVPGLSGVASVATSSYANVALKGDGSVWAWGALACHPDHIPSSGMNVGLAMTPAQVAGLAGTTAVAMTPSFSSSYSIFPPSYVFAVKSNGEVLQCGAEDYPRMRSTTLRMGVLAKITSVAASSFYGLALRDDGTVWAWGFESAPETGYGVIHPPQTPEVVAGLGGVTSIAAGFDHAVAIKNDGTVWAWGNNRDGQLGDGGNTSSGVPVQASINANDETNIRAIEFYHAGTDHYFVTASAGEAAYLDNKPDWGWARTGKTFSVWPARAWAPGGTAPVCRFFGVFANGTVGSHFYTVDAAECDMVKGRPDWGWGYEGDAFYAVNPAGGACPGGTAPVYRAYNNGMGGAPNHRYMTSQAEVDAMVAQGWVPEGIAFCGAQ